MTPLADKEGVFNSVDMFCPDDGRRLTPRCDGFSCGRCQRAYPLLNGCALDLRPGEPDRCEDFGARYAEQYRSIFFEPLTFEETRAPWGDPQSLSARERRAVERHVQWVSNRLLARVGDGSALTLCDVSGGPGRYSLALSSAFKYVLHCDLSGRAISYVWNQARERGITNIGFIRCDYLQLPFSSSLPRIICLDTLIRGEEHERRLLHEILHALAVDGVALVDFHNWWHNPLRRLGLMPDNFVGNRSYSRREVRELLPAQAHATIEAYHAEAMERRLVGTILRLLPATRHGVLLARPGIPSERTPT